MKKILLLLSVVIMLVLVGCGGSAEVIQEATCTCDDLSETYDQIFREINALKEEHDKLSYTYKTLEELQETTHKEYMDLLNEFEERLPDPAQEQSTSESSSISAATLQRSTCSSCDGRGSPPCFYCNGTAIYRPSSGPAEVCQRCNGRGTRLETCSSCHGTGFVLS